MRCGIHMNLYHASDTNSDITGDSSFILLLLLFQFCIEFVYSNCKKCHHTKCKIKSFSDRLGKSAIDNMGEHISNIACRLGSNRYSSSRRAFFSLLGILNGNFHHILKKKINRRKRMWRKWT